MIALLALKIILLLWLAAFAWYFVRAFFDDDPKFGKYNWQIALITAVIVPTFFPPWMLYDFCKSPMGAYKSWILEQYD